MENVMNKIIFKKWINQKFEITQEMVNKKCLIILENVIFDIIQKDHSDDHSINMYYLSTRLDSSISKKNPITFGTEKN